MALDSWIALLVDSGHSRQNALAAVRSVLQQGQRADLLPQLPAAHQCHLDRSPTVLCSATTLHTLLRLYSLTKVPACCDCTCKHVRTHGGVQQALGCGPGDHEGHAKALVAGKKDSIKAQKGLMEELAGLHGRELAQQCKEHGTAAMHGRAAVT